MDKDSTWMSRIATNLRLEWAITDMESKLIEARNKDVEKGTPLIHFLDGTNTKYADVERRIKILREFQHSYLEVIEENRVLDNLVFKITKQFHHMDDKIKRLENEIETLKKANQF